MKAQTKLNISVLLLALGVSVLSDQIYLVALTVWILQRTHSALAVSGLWIAPPLAGLILGSFLGSLADRWDRRTSLIGANLVSAPVYHGHSLAFQCGRRIGGGIR